jgi:hypothetical protein
MLTDFRADSESEAQAQDAPTRGIGTVDEPKRWQDRGSRTSAALRVRDSRTRSDKKREHRRERTRDFEKVTRHPPVGHETRKTERMIPSSKHMA